jgi:hypothetical protein
MLAGQQEASARRQVVHAPSDAERVQTEAERAQAAAKAQRDAALRAADEARTEAQRLVAAEKIRVLGRKAELSEIRGRVTTKPWAWCARRAN